MKENLGDHPESGNLLLGGLGSSRTGAAGRVTGSGSVLRRRSGVLSVLASSRESGGGRYEKRTGRDFRSEK